MHDDDGKLYLDFRSVYEGTLVKPLTGLLSGKALFTCNISQLIDIRKGQIESYYSDTDNLYGNSMYLFEFQKQIIDAGLWDAYNYFLFGLCYPDELNEWMAVHRREFEAFTEWFSKNPFRLGDGRSVNKILIFDSYRKIDLTQAMAIQAKLFSAENIE